MASGDATDDLGGLTFAGAALADALGAGQRRDPASSRRCIARSRGNEEELEVRTSAGLRSVGACRCRVTFLPEEGLALVSFKESLPAGTELSDLRSRANDLEVLVTAARRLARSNSPTRPAQRSARRRATSPARTSRRSSR